MRTRQALVLLCLLAACKADDYLAPGQGQLHITLAIGGLDPDPDGAEVVVDGGAPIRLLHGTDTTIALDRGVYTVQLGGLAANCAADGGAVRNVRVRRNEVANLALTATCTAASGVIEVSVVTSGGGPDPDGYLVTVNGWPPPRRVMDGAAVRIDSVPVGVHSIFVRDIAPNCTLAGENPLPGIQVTSGGAARDTVRVALAVACNSGHGDLRLITATTGPADPDGYVILLGTSPVQRFRLGANDTLLLTSLAEGVYSVTVTDIAGNCVPAQTQQFPVSIVGDSTTELGVNVDCVAPAILRVTAPTTGVSLDPGYLVTVDGGTPQVLIAGTTLSLDLIPGTRTIALGDIAPNCAVSGSNPVAVTLTTAAPTDLAFPVTCTASGRTGLDLTIVTSGNDPDDSYFLWVCNGGSCDGQTVPGTTTLQLDLSPGDYLVALEDVAGNCAASSPAPLTVTAGQVATARIDVTCAYWADFLASVTVTGTDQQGWFQLTVDGVSAAELTPDSSVVVSSSEGLHAIGLEYVEPNCSVIGPNPATVTLVAGVLTPVDFTVDCQSLPIVAVSVTTNGSNVPLDFLVGIDPDPFIGYLYQSPVAATGTVSIKVGIGQHTVWLDQVPPNCTVSTANPVTVNAALTETVDVSFTVACQ